MHKVEQIREELVEKFQRCMREVGCDPDVDRSKHESVVHSRMHVEGETLRVVVHLATREARPLDSGVVSRDVVSQKLATAAIRPSLNVRAAVGPERGAGVVETAQEIYEKASQAQGGSTGSAGVVAETLEKLVALREAGELTRAEYEELKSQLFARSS